MGLAQKVSAYTYADIENRPANERWELIDGVAYNMSPPPSRIHQKISGELFFHIRSYLQGKTCEVYSAPFGVWFTDKDIQIAADYVEPDITIVCDKAKLTEKGCIGAPDMIIEVLSPATAAKDLCKKLNLYENNGVTEYWIVHPTDSTVMVFQLSDGKYGKPKIYSPKEGAESAIKVGIFENLTIDLTEIFTSEL